MVGTSSLRLGSYIQTSSNEWVNIFFKKKKIFPFRSSLLSFFPMSKFETLKISGASYNFSLPAQLILIANGLTTRGGGI